MYVASCHLELSLPASNSLKDKRQVLRSVIARVRQRFNVAIAEVDYQDSWRSAALGLAAVSNSATHAEATVQAVIDFITESRLDAEIGDAVIDVSPFI